MNSEGEVMITSTTATDTTLKIYVIDKDEKATQYKLKDIFKVNVLSVLVVVSLSGSTLNYVVNYGYDVTFAVTGVSSKTSGNASYIILNLAYVLCLSLLILI